MIAIAYFQFWVDGKTTTNPQGSLKVDLTSYC